MAGTVLPVESVAEKNRQALLRMQAVAKRLDVALSRAYDLARAGLIPVVRLGREIRVDPDALEAWIAGGGQPLA